MARLGDVIAASKMDESGRAALPNASSHLGTVRKFGVTKCEMSPQQSCHGSEESLRLPHTVKIGVIWQVEKVWIEIELGRFMPMASGHVTIGESVQAHGTSLFDGESFHPSDRNPANARDFLLGGKLFDDIEATESITVMRCGFLMIIKPANVQLQYRAKTFRQGQAGRILEHLVAKTGI
jgi:hypothetical protein